jgi:hypothetical protein
LREVYRRGAARGLGYGLVEVIGEVRVGVDQAGDGGEARQVYGRFFGTGNAGADALNLAGANQGGEEQTCEQLNKALGGGWQ